MQIDIQSQGFALTHGMRDYAEGRLRFALVRAGERIRRVAMRLYDVNGPRRTSKCCRIQVMLNGSAAVVIEETQADHYLAIHRATGRKLMCRLARHDARPGEDRTGLATPAAR